MRLIILIPELLPGGLYGHFIRLIQRRSRVRDSGLVRWLLTDARLYTRSTSGGTLNVMRHGVVARGLGADVALATLRGRDTYGSFNIVDLPFVRWSDRRRDDVCLIPDFCSGLVDHVKGPVILYLQVPIFLYRNFDYLRPDVRLWTDSPFMLEKCRETWPGKDITIVPNIVDSSQFPFVPQSERDPGLIFAFPRKGPEFIAATRAAYAALGGTYWRFELIDGLPLVDLARAMRRPQAFLASAEVEGCALPPQESMAAGIVVVGKSARGANFAMEHRRTAMVAETPADAAVALRELEESDLRDTIARNAHALISRYFPENEPTEFWRNTLREHGFIENGGTRSKQPALGATALTS